MAIPAYKNISGQSIDVPTDSGASQRVPPDHFVKGEYFVGVFDAHSTLVDGVTKYFPTDIRWQKFADADDVDQTLIVVNNLPGYGNRLQLVDPPASPAADGFKGQVALDGTTIYLCTESGLLADTPTAPATVVDSSVGAGAPGTTEIVLDHTPTSITSVLVDDEPVLAGEGAGKYTLDGDTITLGTAAVEVDIVITYVWDGPYPRWAKATNLTTVW
jgi:hypothetical protein